MIMMYSIWGVLICVRACITFETGVSESSQRWEVGEATANSSHMSRLTVEAFTSTTAHSHERTVLEAATGLSHGLLHKIRAHRCCNV